MNRKPSTIYRHLCLCVISNKKEGISFVFGLRHCSVTLRHVTKGMTVNVANAFSGFLCETTACRKVSQMTIFPPVVHVTEALLTQAKAGARAGRVLFSVPTARVIRTVISLQPRREQHQGGCIPADHGSSRDARQAGDSDRIFHVLSGARSY